MNINDPSYRMLEVSFGSETLAGPCVNVMGVTDGAQVVMIDCIDVGPFPDWEAISRRVMRHVIAAGRRNLG